VKRETEVAFGRQFNIPAIVAVAVAVTVTVGVVVSGGCVEGFCHLSTTDNHLLV